MAPAPIRGSAADDRSDRRWIDLAAVCAELTARKSELEVALSARESRLRGKKKPRSAGLQSVVKRSGRSLSAATIQLLRER